MKIVKRQLIVLCMLCGIAFMLLAGLMIAGGTQAETKAEEISVFSCDPSLLNSIRIETDGRLLFLTRQSGTDVNWVLEDSGEAVNEARLAQMLAEIEDVKSDTVIENVTDFAPYGLDTPSMTISLALGGMGYDLEIGDYTANAHRYYARANGEDRVFLLTTSVKAAFDITAEELAIE